ncbi:MAG: L-threonylcarbamoyladenylate synthase [Planctomycetota bacterium]
MRAFQVPTNKTEGKSLRTAVAVLRAGGIVAFPTETVYGICVDPGNEAAVRRLYELKGRDGDKACAYLLGEAEDARLLAPDLPPNARRLAEAFWPGPLTLVVPGSKKSRVGLRLSSIPLARALARQFGGPLLQSSANRSGHPAALNAAGLVSSLGEGVDLLLNAGRVEGGASSTVVACTETGFKILREGAIPAEEIESTAVERVLVVCTGNICRSPMAAHMLVQLSAEALKCAPDELPRRALDISSCGTHGWDDATATPEAERAAKELGYDLSEHRSRPFDLTLLGTAHRVWCMESHHVAELEPYFQERPGVLELFDPDGGNVPDPFRRSMRTYRKVAKRIEAISRARATELTSRQ